MIIVDSEIDKSLAKELEKIKADSIKTRCIYFNTNISQPAPQLFKERAIKSIKEHIALYNPHIYFCDDGDLFIISSTLDRKNAKKLILDIATFIGKPATDDWVSFVELPLNINKLIIVAETKLENARKLEEEKKRIEELKQLEHKRREILNVSKVQEKDLKQIRSSRKTPELMIIEDDSFSRRLVENVLQKKYNLTALGEATYALDTYSKIAPDLLFLDINLPDVTGHELLEKIMTFDPNAYVIMLSSNSDRENVMQAMNKGAKGFVAKPFSKEKLFHYIEHCPTISQEK